MSPILIAILAVYCCIVGFVIGRITAKPRTSEADKAQLERIRRAGYIAGQSFLARRRQFAENFDPEESAFDRARSEYIRRAIETGDSLNPSGTRLW